MKKLPRTLKQQIAFDYAMEHDYSIWAIDPRLGKSRVAVEVQQALKNFCLIICPGYLVVNWPKEIRKWARKDVQVTVFKKGSDVYEPCDSDFVVISYDLVQKAEHLFEWADMVVIDESHHLKSMKAKRTEFIHRVIFENSVKRLHLLSGTILKNRVQEFYSPVAMMHYNPRYKTTKFLDRFPDEIAFADHFSFRREYNVPITNKKGQKWSMPVLKWVGLRNKLQLKKYLVGKYIRIKADDKDLPPVTTNKILISDSPDTKLLQAFNDFFDGDGMDSVKPEVKVEAALKKVPFTIKYVEDLLEEVKCVLVYSDHVQPIEQIAKHFKVQAITGKVPGPKRSKLAKDFQAGNGRILCATIGALKEGEDLFRSRDIVLNDLAWTPGDMKQVINRIRGLGQKDPRTVHMIFGSPQDAKIALALDEKMAVIDGAT